MRDTDGGDIVLKKQGNEITISGDLTQKTVMSCFLQSEKLISNAQAIHINLSEVSSYDSASLAFLTSLLRLAKQKNVTLKLTGMPTQMLALASASGLLPILPLEN